MVNQQIMSPKLYLLHSFLEVILVTTKTTLMLRLHYVQAATAVIIRPPWTKRGDREAT